jgi:hypothetical protein
LRTLEISRFSTFYGAALGRLLTAAGRPEAARARLDTALQLARDTELHLYDAELLRLRAHVQHDPTIRRADVDAAIQLARRQGATLFELRAALDDYALRGEPARSALMSVVARMPADSALPEMARDRQVLMGQLRVPRAGRGRPRTRPQAVLGDRVYSSRATQKSDSTGGGVGVEGRRPARRIVVAEPTASLTDSHFRVINDIAMTPRVAFPPPPRTAVVRRRRELVDASRAPQTATAGV